MSLQQLRIDVMSEILETIGVTLTSEQVTTLAHDFAYHMEMEREFSYTPAAPTQKECETCKHLRSEIKGLEADINHYRDNVKRRHPGARHVYLDRGGNVMYDY